MRSRQIVREGLSLKPTALPVIASKFRLVHAPFQFLSLGATMNDQAAKLFAGHAGVCAVLVDMLIDKGIVSQGEVLDRFQRAQTTAGDWSESRVAARELADIVAHLKPVEAGAPLIDRT